MPDASFEPKDPGYDSRVRASFARQSAMQTIGAVLTRVEPGRVQLELPWAAHLTQQHGFLHGGILATALDSACGYSALTLMPAEAAALSIEFKINLIAPAKGQGLRVEAQCIKAGRTLSLAEGRAYAFDGAREKLVATMACTVMALYGRRDLEH